MNYEVITEIKKITQIHKLYIGTVDRFQQTFCRKMNELEIRF